MSILTMRTGVIVRCGRNSPDEFRNAAVPAWAERNPVLQESDCDDHDDLAKWYPESLAQGFNNCTNASIAAASKAQLESQGIQTPNLSRSYQYAQCNGGRDQGASCRQVIQNLMGNGPYPGLPAESLYPENQIYMPRGGFPQHVIDDAKTRIAFEVYQCLSWADVISAVARRFFVYQGYVLGQNWFGVPKSGKVASWDGRFENGHATPQHVIDDAKTRIAFEVYQCLSWADVISAVARRFFVYQGYVLGQNWFSVPKSGKVASWDGRFENGHATIARGLTRKFGDLRVIVPNTWGPSFGDNGVGYVDQSYYWTQRGNFVNLEAYAIRAFKIPDADLPQGV